MLADAHLLTLIIVNKISIEKKTLQLYVLPLHSANLIRNCNCVYDKIQREVGKSFGRKSKIEGKRMRKDVAAE